MTLAGVRSKTQSDPFKQSTEQLKELLACYMFRRLCSQNLSRSWQFPGHLKGPNSCLCPIIDPSPLSRDQHPKKDDGEPQVLLYLGLFKNLER